MFHSWSNFDFPCKCNPTDPAVIISLSKWNKSWLKMCSHTAKDTQFVTDLRQFCYKCCSIKQSEPGNMSIAAINCMLQVYKPLIIVLK